MLGSSLLPTVNQNITPVLMQHIGGPLKHIQ